MVKNSENSAVSEDKSDSKASRTINGFIAAVALVAVIGFGGWYLYQNPQLLKTKEVNINSNAQIEQLQNSLYALQNKVAKLEGEVSGKIAGRELAVLNERIDTHARLNKEILDSKAGNNTVLNMINRIDMLEVKVNNLGKVSSDGALILTAAMMVKDSAAKGESFEYEAEVLRQLALGTNLQEPAEVIAQYAYRGIPCKKKLIEEFNQLYAAQQENLSKIKEAEVAKQNESSDWKEKINQKLSKLVSVNYHNEEKADNVEQFVDEDGVYTLVNNGKFDEAVLVMNRSTDYQSKEFQDWQIKVSARDNFNRALKKIQAITLAVMKTENLKHTND